MKVVSKKVIDAIQRLNGDFKGKKTFELRTENTRPNLFKNKYVLYAANGGCLEFQPVNSFKTQKEFIQAVENFIERGHIWEIFKLYA